MAYLINFSPREQDGRSQFYSMELINKVQKWR
jgi:hypothetical protein